MAGESGGSRPEIRQIARESSSGAQIRELKQGSLSSNWSLQMRCVPNKQLKQAYTVWMPVPACLNKLSCLLHYLWAKSQLLICYCRGDFTGICWSYFVWHFDSKMFPQSCKLLSSSPQKWIYLVEKLCCLMARRTMERDALALLLMSL